MKSGKEKTSSKTQQETVGKRIAALRKSKHETQEALAQELGLTRSAICQWENGNTLPNYQNILNLAKHFEVTVGDLLNAPASVPPGILSGLKAFSAYLETEITPLMDQGGENNDAGNHKSQP